MRLYRALIRFLRVATRMYFLEVHTTGAHQVPESGPVILASNHPGSVLDAVLLSTRVPRVIHYLARSGLFRFPIIATLFRRLGAIPVYRPHEVADASERNVEMYSQVFKKLEEGGCIGIFPEGRNSPWAQVGPLRKGAARMALGAEARNHWQLGLVIVPVGVNFEHRELFMSEVLLRFGRPIDVADFREPYERDPEQAIGQLTATVQDALRRQALHLEDRRLERLVSDLSETLGAELAADLEREEQTPEPPPARNRFKDFIWKLLGWYYRSTQATSEALETRILSRQHIGRVLAQADQDDPRRVDALRNHLERYRDHLGQTRLRRDLGQAFDEPVRERWIRLRLTVFALAMAPVALFGLVHNAVPYLLTKYLPRLAADQAIRAFAYFGVGVLTFVATYAGFGYWLWRHTDMTLPWTLAYIAALPPTGFAALGYRRTILVYRNKILVRTVFWNNADLARLLRHERRALFSRFQALAVRYSTSP